MTVVAREWWIRHAPVPDDGRIDGVSDVAADTGEAACFATSSAGLPLRLEPSV